MLEGLYSAAAGMESAQYQLTGVSNNIANSDTPGYQSEEIGFHDLVYATENAQPTSALIGAGSGAQITGYSQAEGNLQQTGEPLDVALSGDGYIEVRQGNGTVGLTRNGTLQLNAAGQITTATGMELDPPITLPKGTQSAQVKIATDGVVSVGNRAYGKLSVVDVPASDKLLPQGNSVYSATAASGQPRTAAGTTVLQGYLEQSNVDMDTEVTNMETAQQAYSMDSKAVEFESQMGQIAATLH
jgi:flagellar basal-body rod protein FlgG